MSISSGDDAVKSHHLPPQTFRGAIKASDWDLWRNTHKIKETPAWRSSLPGRTRNLWIRSPARSSIAPQRPHHEHSIGTRTEKSRTPASLGGSPDPTPTPRHRDGTKTRRPDPSPLQPDISASLPSTRMGDNPGYDPYLAQQRGCSKNLEVGLRLHPWQPLRSISGSTEGQS